MTARSAFRAIAYLARDIPRALRRMTALPEEDESYAKHMAELAEQHNAAAAAVNRIAGLPGAESGERVAEAFGETECCAREAGYPDSPVKHGPGSRPEGPNFQRESIAAGATLTPEEELLRCTCAIGGAFRDICPTHFGENNDEADERLADCGLGGELPEEFDPRWEMTGPGSILLPSRLVAPLTADETILVRQVLAERFPESSAAPVHSSTGAAEPPAADPPPQAAGGTPLSPAEAHKQALTQALAEDRKRLRCNAYKPLHPDRCTKLAGHEGKHSYDGTFWDFDPSK